MSNRLAFPEFIQEKTPVFLAPMSGITDLPFRKLVRSFGARYVVSEMIASTELLKNRREYQRRVEFLPSSPNIIQIAGREPEPMGEAAALISDKGADLIDINMGCPSRHVTAGASGCALMKDPCLAAKIMAQAVKSASCPVSLKMRLGWDRDSLNAPLLARIAEEEGIKILTVHGRTRDQFYKGHADWSLVYKTVEATKLPVIVNGDIVDVNSAKNALDHSGADGVMIGRGAQGRPWLIEHMAQRLSNQNLISKNMRAENKNMGEIITCHYEDMLSFYGLDLGLKNARKHLGWYIETLFKSRTDHQQNLRKLFLPETNPKRVCELIWQEFAHISFKNCLDNEANYA